MGVGMVDGGGWGVEVTQQVCWHGRVKVRVGGSCRCVVGRGRQRLVRLLLLLLP